MSIDFIRPEVDELRPRISVIGVGGAGGNAIANMMRADVQGVDFVVANTDAQSLNNSEADRRIQLGLRITQGLGAGSRPEIGRAAAEETLDEIMAALEGAHMCFIAAGMGGGTGTGAAPVIAKAARDKGILTVGVVTKPFAFEGARRGRSADSGTAEADGDNRAIEAAEKAISNPLLDGVSMKGAKGVIISITGGEDMRLMEVDEAASHIKELVDPDANIIWGSAFNNDLGGKIRVSVVATGIEADAAQAPQPGKVFTFPTARTAPPAPAKPAELDEATTAEDETDILDLSSGEDELLLDAEDILTSPVSSAPIAPPTDDEFLGDSDADSETVRPSTPPSGTLFERMSNIARG